MNLVGYSDSENSETEALPTSNQVIKSSVKAAPKLTDPTTSKVKINFSSLTSGTGQKEEDEQNARPAKRQRTGGGLNINAFLPAPKQPARQLGDNENTSKRAPGKGLGRGVNLKTGAEPAFNRSSLSSLDVDEEPRDIKEVIAELRKSRPPTTEPVAPPRSAEKEVKMMGSAMKFKPLSVTRNGPKKKKAPATVSPAITNAAQVNVSTATPNTESTTQTKLAKASLTKSKVSLFSLGQENAPANISASTGDYEPVMLEDTETTEVPDEAFESYEQDSAVMSTQTPAASTLTAQSVEGFNLSESDMRKLFGRKAGKNGGPDLSSINMVNFNTEAEYAANEELRAKGETSTFNPVRAIAPGKHSLKQLVNAAQTQKDALEDHFARGKANQREAGAKYGW